MPFEHLSTFQVRHYECDAHGHFNNAGYLRYIHDVEMEALPSVGADAELPFATNVQWRAKEIFLDYQIPLRAGDTVRLRATVVNLQGDRALWAYVFQQDGTALTCAKAQILYALCDATNAKSVPFPLQIKERMQPLEAGLQPLTRIEFPTLPPRPPGALSGSWDVEWRDLDQGWYLKNAAYLEYFSEFITKASAGLGWPLARYLDEGVLWIIRKQWLRIFQPARQGDRLRITTWLSDVKRTRATRHYTAHRQDTAEPICQGHTLWVCVDSESGRPARMPDAFLQDFAPQIAGANA